MEPKTARESAYTGTKSPYLSTTQPTQPTLLHSTPQDASDCPESLVIADFMVVYRSAESGSRAAYIALLSEAVFGLL